ncbi:MAG: hypothetical protein JRN15_10960, partial [Nitrososphaerota archaeon]|nr:hypothetical protein [Nitrososphaerota archaeon]
SALHISQDSEAYQRYEEGKYQPQREAIKFAKRYIPIMGELWGSLSEAAVHTNMRTYGPQINIDSEGNSIKSIVFQFNGREVKPIQDKLVLTLLSLVSLVILKISELIFFANSPSYKDALQLKGTNTIYFCNTDASINRYYDEFRSYIPMTK